MPVVTVISCSGRVCALTCPGVPLSSEGVVHDRLADFRRQAGDTPGKHLIDAFSNVDTLREISMGHPLEAWCQLQNREDTEGIHQVDVSRID